MDHQKNGLGKSIMATAEKFLLRRADEAFSLSETYWVNTKLYPQRALVDSANDPISIAKANGAMGWVKTIEAVVATCGKRYTTFPTVNLPKPSLPRSASLRKSCEHRSSGREFDAGRSMRLQQLSTLLSYSYGWNHARRRKHSAFKHVPSAGGLYPLEFYVASASTRGLAPNTVYHYRPSGHLLECLRTFENGFLSGLFAASPWVTDANSVVFVTGVLPRLTWKYGERALRYLLLDAGHAVQNACLAAAALGIALCPVVDFYDDPVHDFLDVDGISENVVYAFAMGVPKSAPRHSSHRRAT